MKLGILKNLYDVETKIWRMYQDNKEKMSNAFDLTEKHSIELDLSQIKALYQLFEELDFKLKE